MAGYRFGDAYSISFAGRCPDSGEEIFDLQRWHPDGTEARVAAAGVGLLDLGRVLRAFGVDVTDEDAEDAGEELARLAGHTKTRDIAGVVDVLDKGVDGLDPFKPAAYVNGYADALRAVRAGLEGEADS